MSDWYLDPQVRELVREGDVSRTSAWSAPSPAPSSRVLPQVSEEAAETISSGGGLFSGAWRRFTGGILGGGGSSSTPVQRANETLGVLSDSGRQIGTFLNESRTAYGTPPPAGTFPSMEGPQWQGYRDGGLSGRGDAEQILQSMDPAQVARLQDRLVAAGFMSGGAFAVGSPVDDKTIDAFRGLLGYSNSQGTVWQAALSDVEQIIKETGVGADEAGGGRAPFVAPTYIAPDYATLAQTVKNELRSTLGRDPDESEMALLTAELAGWDRDAFDNEVAAQRAEFDAAEEGRDVPGEAQSIDPVARFKESFESKFAAELSGIDRSEEAAETQELTRGAVSTLSRMSGGMG